MEHAKILIIDLGSQYTLVIGRVLRELGYRSLILSPDKAESFLLNETPQAIILSGGFGSVLDKECLRPPEIVFTLGVPLLGICLGMQWIVEHFGGVVTPERVAHKEYGPVFIKTQDSVLFRSIKEQRTLVWASHGDATATVPDGFSVIGKGEDYGSIAAIANEAETIIGIQFHPEVQDTIEGKKMIHSFLVHAGCVPDWSASDVIASIQNEVFSLATKDTYKAVLGFSGGVDSSVVAALLQPVFKDNLLCVVIDTGFLREGELDEIRERAEMLQVSHVILYAKKRFMDALRGVTDPEEKRKIFSSVYKDIFEEAVQKYGAHFVVQGSLATDFIESGKVGETALIKSHHNIDVSWSVADVHPLRHLFKYEVREIGKALGLPQGITERQPFPGPGLLSRIFGTEVTNETITTLRQCDMWVREIIEEYGLTENISQLVVGLDGSKTVGVKGDGRIHGYNIVVRPFVTNDFMTGKVFFLPEDVVTAIIQKCTKHPLVARVFFDYTPKPPATIEFE